MRNKRHQLRACVVLSSEIVTRNYDCYNFPIQQYGKKDVFFYDLRWT
jgi:hypothetical protein